MTTELAAPRRSRLLQPILSRPHLFISIAVGVVAYLVSALWMARGVTRVLAGWDSGVVVFLALSFVFMLEANHDQLKRRAIEHDEGRHLILALTILAAVASIWALIAELSAAKGHPRGELRILLATGTVVLSWLFVQTVFALHYAHVYYLKGEQEEHRKGLEFGDPKDPDYWDFFHFSVVMGATAQTADVVFRSKELRRVGTLHTLIAFAFNTAILATMINLAANLF